jgi:hypothetical protein
LEARSKWLARMRVSKFMESSVMDVSPIRRRFVGFVSYGRLRQLEIAETNVCPALNSKLTLR